MAETILLTGDALLGIEPRAVFGVPVAGAVQQVKLGRVSDPTNIFLAKMLSPKLSDFIDIGIATLVLPPSTNWRAKATKSLDRMYLNDQYGDCVIAGSAHHEGVWTANDTPETAVATDQEILATYRGWCGHLGNDAGCIITQVLDKWRSEGLLVNGVRRKIDGYADCNNTNKDLVKAAIHLFGALKLGIMLPRDWTNNAVWDVTSSPIVGGHDVAAIDYDDRGVYVSSWGRVYLITWAAFQSTKWVEECWVVLSASWYNNDQLSPSGVSVAQLRDAITKIGGGNLPTVDPPVPPTPPGPTPVTGLPDGGGISWRRSGAWTHEATRSYANIIGSISFAKTASDPNDLPPAPSGFNFTIPVPKQPVKILGLEIGNVPPHILQGTAGDVYVDTDTVLDQLDAYLRFAGAGDKPLPSGDHLPDWLTGLLKGLCQFGKGLPTPWNHLAEFLCGLQSEQRKALPPFVVVILRQLCRIAPILPEPYRMLVALLCRLVPQTKETTPCSGC